MSDRNPEAAVAHVQQRPDRLLRVSEVAERLAYSQPSIYRLIQDGVIPGIKIGDGVRVRESDLDAMILTAVEAARASRARQGLPPKVTNQATLDRLAAKIALDPTPREAGEDRG